MSKFKIVLEVEIDNDNPNVYTTFGVAVQDQMAIVASPQGEVVKADVKSVTRILPE